MSNNERMTINRRSLEEAVYIVSQGATLEETAKAFGVTEERVYIDITQYLNKSTRLYKAVIDVLAKDEYYIDKSKTINRTPISVRSRELGMFMVTQNTSLEEAARVFGITKEIAYDDITQELNKDTILYKRAMEIIKNDAPIQRVIVKSKKRR